MRKTKEPVRIEELKQHLNTIVENRLPVCFRYRLVGEMWQPNFMRVLKVSEEGLLLNDEFRNKIISITDLSSIMQFEFDAPVMKLEPHFHYQLSDTDN